MKKQLLLLTLFAAITAMTHAQTTMHVYLKNGERVSIGISDIDSIAFADPIPKGSIDNPYTVAELLEACSGLAAGAYLNDGAEVCARGIVTKVQELSTQYGNATYYISDTPQAENQFLVYRGFLLDKARVTVGDELVMGDTVSVFGKVKFYNGRTLEFDTGNYIVAIRKYRPTDEVANAIYRLEFPQRKEGDENLLLVHTATLNDLSEQTGINYSVEWDTNIHAQRWSCYQMYDALLQRNTSRTETGYPNDPFLPQGYHFTKDPYSNSGYDHGHICPSADRLASAESNEQTFYMTNMQPQVHAFNAGIWERMESQVRSWASSAYFDTLYVCKGGTIDQASQIYDYLGSGDNKIPIPKYFFMALLAKQHTGGYTALGFWVEHSSDIASTASLANFAVNIRELEQLTGLDFFHNLPDSIEESVETLPLTNLKNVWGL